MTRPRLAGAPWAPLLALAPAAAPASLPRDADCRTLQALTAVDGDAFSRLRFAIAAERGVQLRVGRVRPDLAPAAACDADVDSYGVTVSCRWEFDSLAAATGFYEPLVARIRRCLDTALPERTSIGSEGLRFVRHNGDALRVGPASSSVRTSLLEFTHDLGNYWVQIEIDYDPEGAQHLADESD